MVEKVVTKIFAECDSPRPTKNTSHFTEIGGKSVLNGGVYVTAEALAKIGNPEKVRVTVEAV